MERNKDGTFLPGSTPNPTGRPKGSLNNSTKELREFFSDFINDNRDKIQKDFDELGGKDRIKFLLEITRFVLPIQKAIEVTNSEAVMPSPITFTRIDNNSKKK